ncbi:PREDICTED: probable polygalacturonase At3g15720 [Erythranthe guttata]|uniref:probable polygalacturonase At3g15720 n=1 Tax=Erythranthe guttata TaxID=4155 RepID=UPI00064E094B|nr:PREDICTED: probable polygalacturonase At3g15720 [Erythranthe guttata]|eukprot:XP_012839290.1 PREDICTED: probable polygalacturonase At3g15720 [Erythranthe guttata]
MGDSSYNNTFFTVLLILSLLLLFTTNSESTVFNVLDYGAVGNGLTDDTNAFANAWKATCASSSSSSPMMHVPSGKTFFVQPLEFDGPCESDTIIVEIEGNFVAPSDPSSWDCGKNDCENWISFRRVDGLRVSGHGSFDGRGQKWWDGKTLEIASSDDVRLGDGLRFKDSPRVHLVLNSLRNAYVSHVSIEAPESSPNTDGIRVSSCTNVHIDHTRIGTDFIDIRG